MLQVQDSASQEYFDTLNARLASKDCSSLSDSKMAEEYVIDESGIMSKTDCQDHNGQQYFFASLQSIFIKK